MVDSKDSSEIEYVINSSLTTEIKKSPFKSR